MKWKFRGNEFETSEECEDLDTCLVWMNNQIIGEFRLSDCKNEFEAVMELRE